jgi:hypothetical protein
VAHTQLTQSQLMTGNFLNIWNQFGCGSACLLLLPSATRVCHAAEMMQQHGARVDTRCSNACFVFCFRWIHTDFRCLFNAPLRLIHSPLASQRKQKCQRIKVTFSSTKRRFFYDYERACSPQNDHMSCVHASRSEMGVDVIHRLFFLLSRQEVLSRAFVTVFWFTIL